MEQFEFEFEFQSLVKVWVNTTFNVTASSYEEAVQLAKEQINKASHESALDNAIVIEEWIDKVDKHWDCETAFDTQRLLSPHENNGNETLVMFAFDPNGGCEKLYSNGTPE
jgi:hypothetical protein